jgi:hypothetical protein
MIQLVDRSLGRMEASMTADDQLFIHPAQALRPGERDARNLLIAWCIRRSAYPLLFLGLIGAYATTGGSGSVVWDDPGVVIRELTSPIAGLLLAVIARVVASQTGLVMAFWFARERDRRLDPRTGINRRLARVLDLRQASKSFRALRWTHHVRQEAVARVAPTGGWWRQIDKTFDVATIVLAIGVGVASLVTAV